MCVPLTKSCFYLRNNKMSWNMKLLSYFSITASILILYTSITTIHASDTYHRPVTFNLLFSYIPPRCIVTLFVTYVIIELKRQFASELLNTQTHQVSSSTYLRYMYCTVYMHVGTLFLSGPYKFGILG